MPYGALPYGRGQYALRLPTFVALPILCADTTWAHASANMATEAATGTAGWQTASAATTTTAASAAADTSVASAVTAWGCCAP